MTASVYTHAEQLNAPCVTLTRKMLKEALYSTEPTAIKAILHNAPVLKPYLDENPDRYSEWG